MIFGEDITLVKHEVDSIHPELRSVSHQDLVGIIEGMTPASQEVREAAVGIHNELFPEYLQYNLEDAQSPIMENPFDFDPELKDLL